VSRPVFDGAGALVEYVGTIVDITERVRGEQKLRESESRLRLLTDAVPQHVWSHGTDGSITFVNRRWLEYTGRTLGDAQHGGWLRCVHPGDVPALLGVWRLALARGDPFDAQIRYRRADGEYRRFMLRGVPLRDEQGIVVEWVGTSTDFEDLARVEEALRDARAELVHVNRQVTMGALAASLAHELNQPLTAIVTHGSAALEWLEHNPPRIKKVGAAITATIRAAERAGDIVARTRAFLRKAATKEVLEPANLVRDVHRFVDLEAAKHHVIIRDAIADRVPRIIGARSELQQVLLNLVVNGIEAVAGVPERRRRLVIRCRPARLRQRAGVLFAVEDAGIGITSQESRRLFEPFYTTKANGLGMGLYIAHTIVEAHGGRLLATRNRRYGTTFQFVLPAAASP
jgi:PAS domain S-box-containing protein